MDQKNRFDANPANRFGNNLEERAVYFPKIDDRRAVIKADSNAAWLMGMTGAQTAIASPSYGSINMARTKLRDRALAGPNLERDRAGEYISSTYGLLREMGIVYREAADNVLKPVNLNVDIIQGLNVKRSDFYKDMVGLGSRLFNGLALQRDRNDMRATVKYPVISRIQDAPLASAATHCFTHDVTVRLWDDIVGARLPVILTDSVNINRANYDANFNAVQLELRSAPEVMAKGLMLDKRNITELDSDQLNSIQRVMGRSGMCNTVVRFVKWWSYFLYLEFSGKQNFEVEVPAPTNIVVRNYNARDLASTCQDVLGGATTVIHYSSTNTSYNLMSTLGVLQFPLVELDHEGRHMCCGGFYIGSEIPTAGRIVIIGQNLSAQNNTRRLTIDKEGIYTVICEYARLNNKYTEMIDGLCLALCFVMSDGMPSFSLPKAQGIDDIFAPALRRTGTDRKLAPFTLNENLVKGAFAVTRQMIGQVKDMNAISQQARRNNDNLQFVNSNRGIRHNLYGLYSEYFFGHAYDIAGIIDPLNIGGNAQINTLNTELFLSSYWTYTINKLCLIGSFHYYMSHGYWESKDKIMQTDRSTMKVAFSTYNLCRVLVPDEERLPWLVQANEDDIDGGQYRGMFNNLVSGVIRVLPGEVGSVRFNDIDPPDITKFVRVAKPVEDYTDKPVLYNRTSIEKQKSKKYDFVFLDDDDMTSYHTCSENVLEDTVASVEDCPAACPVNESGSTASSNSDVVEKPKPYVPKALQGRKMPPSKPTPPYSKTFSYLFPDSSSSSNRLPRIDNMARAIKADMVGKDSVHCRILRDLIGSTTINAYKWKQFLTCATSSKENYNKLKNALGRKKFVSLELAAEMTRCYGCLPTKIVIGGLGSGACKDRVDVLEAVHNKTEIEFTVLSLGMVEYKLSEIDDERCGTLRHSADSSSIGYLYCLCTGIPTILSQELMNVLKNWHQEGTRPSG